MADIFISYKREEQDKARQLAVALEKKGWSVWWDPKLRAGEYFDDVIEKALNESSCVIVLWSKRSVQSRYVKDESSYALNCGKLVPVAIEDVVLPFRFKGIHTPQLIDWDGSEQFPAFVSLVNDLAQKLGQPAMSEPASATGTTVEERPGHTTKQQDAEPESVNEDAILNRLTHQMLMAPSPRELKRISYELEEYMAKHPLSPEARMLRDRVKLALYSSTQRRMPWTKSIPVAALAGIAAVAVTLGILSQVWIYPGPPSIPTRHDIAPIPPSEHDVVSRTYPPGLGRTAGEVFRDTLKDDSKGPEMVVIEAGKFEMGCVSGKGCEDDESPVHKVTFDKPFAIGKYEVTFEEYDRFAKATERAQLKDRGWGRGQRPVIYVSWEDAAAYAEWLSEQTGKRYRLPTEAEWEYAARAETETPFSTGNCIHTDQANYDGNYDFNECGAKTGIHRKKTVLAGSLPANPWGLQEMHGNVVEWVQDCYHESHEGAPDDGSAWDEADGGDCGRRVIRGGAWNLTPRNLRSAFRDGYITDDRYDYIGFRLAQDL